ncbi:MAG: choice-of-anchor Q domain-containing protein [Dehalococcoidales bacterium]|nr:choice-of-anchor Q domain-containing protein [Dehalococcoidales bacterium]
MDYFVSPNGSDTNPGDQLHPLGTIQRAADIMQTGDNVWVENGIYYERVIITHSGDGNFISYHAAGDKVIVDGSGVPRVTNDQYLGLFDIRGASYIRIDNFAIRNSPGAGIKASGRNFESVEALNNDIYETQNSGIWMGCDERDNRPNIFVKNLKVLGNNLHHTNYSGDQECISLVAVENFEVALNKIRDVRGYENYGFDKEGIDCKLGCRHGQVYANDVSRSRVGIYIDGFGSDAYDIEVFRNILAGNGTGMAFGIEYKMAIAYAIKFFNNLLVNNCASFAINAKGGSDITAAIINNTFYNNNTKTNRRYGWSSDTGTAWSDIFIPNGVEGGWRSRVTFRNNIVCCNHKNYDSHMFTVSGIYPGSEDDLVVDHNLWWEISNFWKSGNIYGINDIKADPRFVDPDNGDFRLQPDSPAIDMGSSDGAPSDDFEGKPRPYGIGFDAGAYEYIGGNIMYVFAPGETKTATIKVNLTVPSGMVLGMELFVGPDINTKKATTGEFEFITTGAQQVITKELTMPSEGGIYKSFLIVLYQGQALLSFMDDEDLILVSGSIDITW